MVSRKNENLACIGSHDQFFSTSNLQLKFESGLWVKTILNLGSEYLMERSSTWSIQIKTIKKFLQTHKKIKCHKQVSGLLQPDQRQKAKPQQREFVDTPTIIPMHERRWIDIEPSEPTLAAYDLSKKVISLLRHNQTVQREDDGAIQFWRIKFHLRNHSSKVQHWSDDRWKACLAAGGGSKRRYQYCSDHSGTILYLRALQGHSGSNLIDPTLQDTVLIGTGIFPHIYHVGCTFNLHSIINNGLIPGGQDLSRRQTLFFLLVDPRDENHKDLEYIDFSVLRRARYMHSAWKRHHDAVFWVDINLSIREGLAFYQTRSKCNNSSRDTSSLLHS